MASTSQNTQLTISVVEMEAMAAIRTIELSSELGFDIVIFEGDCETIIKALTDPSQTFATYGLLIRDAQNLVNQFNGVRFQHVGKEGDKVAHNLARYARHIGGYYVWMEDIPVHCLNVYQADMP